MIDSYPKGGRGHNIRRLTIPPPLENRRLFLRAARDRVIDRSLQQLGDLFSQILRAAVDDDTSPAFNAPDHLLDPRHGKVSD